MAYVDNDVYHFHWCLRFRRFLCRRQVPLFLGYYQSSQDPLSIEATGRDYVARNGSMLPLCSMLKVASRRRVSELSCALSIFNYASVDTCGGIPEAPGVISPQRMTGCCLINQRSVHSACTQQATAQHRANLLGSWDARPFPDSDANLVSNGVIVSAGLFSNSTPEVTIAVPVEEAPEVPLFYRWNSDTCFPTR